MNRKVFRRRKKPRRRQAEEEQSGSQSGHSQVGSCQESSSSRQSSPLLVRTRPSRKSPASPTCCSWWPTGRMWRPPTRRYPPRNWRHISVRCAISFLADIVGLAAFTFSRLAITNSMLAKRGLFDLAEFLPTRANFDGRYCFLGSFRLGCGRFDCRFAFLQLAPFLASSFF